MRTNLRLVLFREYSPVSPFIEFQLQGLGGWPQCRRATDRRGKLFQFHQCPPGGRAKYSAELQYTSYDLGNSLRLAELLIERKRDVRILGVYVAADHYEVHKWENTRAFEVIRLYFAKIRK